MTVVLDSGIWISGFQFGGTPLLALDRAFLFDQIAICEQIVIEVSTILAAKFSWRQQDIDSVLTSYLNDAKHVLVRGEIVGVCRDPKDDMVFECALRAKADLIVSGDKDILEIRRYQSIRVVTARQYVDT